MVKHIDPDMTLLKMPSLKAVKSFVAAAKYQSFTRAVKGITRLTVETTGRGVR
jgi:LysR family glycine cleavage system transcriptional activator